MNNNNLPENDTQALRGQLYRYAEDLQDLMREHRELQKRHLALRHAQGQAILRKVNPFNAAEPEIKTNEKTNANKSTEVDQLSWRETFTVLVVISVCVVAFTALCYIFWQRQLRG